jgi:hypothetical protein
MFSPHLPSTPRPGKRTTSLGSHRKTIGEHDSDIFLSELQPRFQETLDNLPLDENLLRTQTEIAQTEQKNGSKNEKTDFVQKTTRARSVVINLGEDLQNFRKSLKKAEQDGNRSRSMAFSLQTFNNQQGLPNQDNPGTRQSDFSSSIQNKVLRLSSLLLNGQSFRETFQKRDNIIFAAFSCILLVVFLIPWQFLLGTLFGIIISTITLYIFIYFYLSFGNNGIDGLNQNIPQVLDFGLTNSPITSSQEISTSSSYQFSETYGWLNHLALKIFLEHVNSQTFRQKYQQRFTERFNNMTRPGFIVCIFLFFFCYLRNYI